MARQELGTKHSCSSCEAKFYDLNRTPFSCPKCGQAHSAAPASATAAKKTKPPVTVKVKEAPPKKINTSDEDAQTGDKNDDEIDEELLADVVVDAEDDDAEDADVFIEDEDDDSESVTGIVAGGKPDS